MNKELEAFNYISDNMPKMEHCEQVKMNENMDTILKALTPPTQEELFKEIQKYSNKLQLNQLEKFVLTKNGIKLRISWDGLDYSYYDLFDVALDTFKKVPHIIIMIGKYYKSRNQEVK